jgi:hypothetical protein
VKLFHVKAAAEVLAVRRTIRAYIRDGQLRSIRMVKLARRISQSLKGSLQEIAETDNQPQWSLQNRPYVVRAKPAMESARNLDVLLCRSLFGQV